MQAVSLAADYDALVAAARLAAGQQPCGLQSGLEQQINQGLQLGAGLFGAVVPTPRIAPAALFEELLQLAVLEVIPGQVQAFDGQNQPVHRHDAQAEPFDCLTNGPAIGQGHIGGVAAEAGLGGHQAEYGTIVTQARPVVAAPVGIFFLHFGRELGDVKNSRQGSKCPG